MGKVKQNVSSFITNFENCVKDFTFHEIVLTAYLKGNIDFSKMDIKDDSEKDDDKMDFEKGESSQTISLRPQIAKARLIFEKREIPQEREILSLHS